MKETLRVLRTIGVLVGTWALLALVAFVTGVWPTGASGAGSMDPGDDDEGADAGIADGGAPADREAPSPEEVRQAEEIAEALGVGGETAPIHLAWRICAGDQPTPSLAAVDVVGDDTLEIAAGCAGAIDVVAFHGLAHSAAPMRVVRIAADEAAARGAPVAPLRAGDVDGDGQRDLLVGLAGGTRARGAFLIRGAANGGLGAATELAPIATVDLRVVDLDGRRGADMLALTTGNTGARRPSEVWVFAGGAAPTRTATLRAELEAKALTVVDLDLDGHLDAVVASASGAGIVVLFGDGAGAFPRRADIAIAGAAEASVGDLDGNGADDVLVTGTGVHWLASGPLEALVPRPIRAPAGIQAVRLADVDGDRDLDLIGLAGSRVVLLKHGTGDAFEEETLFEIEDALLVRLVLGDFDDDRLVEAALIAKPSAANAPWLLAVTPPIADPTERRLAIAAGAEAPELHDGPLSLRVRLP